MLGNFIDAYERPARLYPALVCLFPVVAVAVGVHGAALSLSTGLVTLVSSFGGLFLLMSLSRDMGKRLEPSLYSEWGGKPTTQLLRHRDTTFDHVTKNRFHEFLGKHIGNTFPTAVQEAADPAAADALYQGGVQWLLGKTRDKTKFPFVFKENVNYGFRRNCLGLKPVGILVALSAMIWTLVASGVLSFSGLSMENVLATGVGAKAAFAVAFTFTLMWVFLITGNSVRRAAFAYADMLIRTCDTLPKRR